MPSPIGPLDPHLALQAARPAPTPARSPFSLPDVAPMDRPSTAAKAAIDRASGAVDLLSALDRQLTFVRDDAAGPMVAELRDGSGSLVRRMTVSDALILLDGLGAR